MTTAAPPLIGILAQLTANTRKRHRTLSKGLTLAYTPGALNEAEPGVYRLALSRRGNWPSDEEVRIVRRDLRAALVAQGRVTETIYVEEYLKGKARKRPSDQVFYHVLFWRELRQASLLQES